MAADRHLVAVAAVVLTALVASACAGGSRDTAADAAGASDICRGPRSALAEHWVEPPADPPIPQVPMTVVDFTGEEIEVTDVSRILALDTYGTLGTTVHALGLGDNLVGRDVSTGVPELADLPVVTHNGHELNAEAILALDPSVVLTDYSIGPLEVQLQLKESGVPVVTLDGNRSRAAIGEQILAVADALGVHDAGVELATNVEQEVSEAEAEVAALAAGNATRMVFLYMRGTSGVYYWFGEESGADDLIEALGGVDVASEVGLEGSRPINAEGLIKSRPELYLMMSDGLSSVGGIDGLAEVPGVADTDAGMYGCVVDMNDHQVLSFGPQFPATIRALAAAIYGPDGTYPSAAPSHRDGNP